MKQNLFLKKFKTSILTVAVSVAFFAVAPFTAFAGTPGEIDYAKETLDNTNSKLVRYTLDQGKTWYPISSSNVLIDLSKFIPASGTKPTVVGFGADGITYTALPTGYDATKGILVTLPVRKAPPSLKYDNVTAGFDSAVALEVNLGAEKITLNATSGTYEATNFLVPVATKVTYKLPGDTAATRFASQEATLTISAAQKEPTKVEFDNTTNMLKNTTTAMQYTVNIAAVPIVWNQCTNGSTDLNADAATATMGAVRFTATDKAPASPMIKFQPIATTSTGTTVANAIAATAATDAEIDWNTEKLYKGTADELQVSFDKGVTWKVVTDDGISLAPVMKPYSTKKVVSELYVRIPAKGSALATIPKKIKISNRPQAPTATEAVTGPVDYSGTGAVPIAAGKVYTVSPISTTTSWGTSGGSATFADIQTATGVPDVLGKTLEIKTAVNTNDADLIVPASATAKYKLKARAAAPAVTFTGLKGDYGSLNGVATTIEWSTDPTFASPAGTLFQASGTHTLLNTDEDTTIFVRTAATATAPASVAKTVKVPYKKPIPAGFLRADVLNCKIENASATYEFNLDGGATYTAYTAAALKTAFGTTYYDSVEKKMASPATVHVRQKGTATAAPSITTQVEFKN